MAQEHRLIAESTLENMSTRHPMEESTTTIESFNFFAAKEESSCTSTKDSLGCAPSSDPAPCSSEYFSTRIESIMESTSEFGSNLETEIEASKEHYSELQAENGEEGSAETNLEVFRSLQKQWPNGLFGDWEDGYIAVGEKVAEGAQGEIFLTRFLSEGGELNGKYVLKVFKEGSRLQDLQKQWPQGMLHKANNSNKPFYDSEGSYKIPVVGGTLLKDGSFGFHMPRCWGDLRKLIDLRMLQNHNQAPPSTDDTAFNIMLHIAKGMNGLLEDNIIHRDLKASNVLILPRGHALRQMLCLLDGFNPISEDNFVPLIADFECSIGVMGTRFWRAPEILLGVKNRDVHPSLFT